MGRSLDGHVFAVDRISYWLIDYLLILFIIWDVLWTNTSVFAVDRISYWLIDYLLILFIIWDVLGMDTCLL